MEDKKIKKCKKINYEVARVYVGKKPMEKAFEKIMEHVLEKNIKDDIEDKQTQA